VPRSPRLENATVPGRGRHHLLLLAVVAALAVILVLQIEATRAELGRRPDYDETQFAHEAWLLAHGQRIYRDFFDSHPPLFVAALRVFDRTYARGPASFDLRALFEHTRIAITVIGTLAVACAGLVSYRVSRSLSALVVVPAVLIASRWTWFRAMADIRVEPFALLCFWGGVALLLGKESDRRAARRIGIGLALFVVVVAFCPKWPCELAVVGVFALIRLRAVARRDRRHLTIALAPPLATLGLALFLLGHVCSYRDYMFFAVRFNGAAVDLFRRSTLMLPVFRRDLFYFCPRPFAGGWPLLGLAIVTLALASPRARRHWVGLDRDGLILLIGLVAAAGFEIFFVYPFPFLWAQYYILWSFALAVLYGCIPAALAGLARGVGARSIQLGAVVAALAIHSVVVRPRLRPLYIDYYWTGMDYMLTHLREGDTVWLDGRQHPVAAMDASYYWDGFGDQAHGALPYAAAHPGGPLPRRDRGDDPICRLERGLEPHLRFVTGGVDLLAMPTEAACFQRLYLAGTMKRTPMPYVFEVVHPTPDPPALQP
jgi:hypothetical protein